jgi:hypothetical protein
MAQEKGERSNGVDGRCREAVNGGVGEGAAASFTPVVPSPIRRFAPSLLNNSYFGSPILSPGGFAVARVCRHFHAKTYGLNS